MYNKRKQKAKFNLRIEFVGILVAIAIMITLSIVLRLPSEKEKLANTFASSSLTKDHVYNEVEFDDLVGEIKSQGYVFVFFGNPTSATSISAITTVNTAASSFEIEEILYLDSTFASEKDREEDEAFDTKLTTMEEKLSTNVNAEVTSEFSLDFDTALWVYLDGELIFNSNDFLNDDETALELTWGSITTRAFCFNLELV